MDQAASGRRPCGSRDPHRHGQLAFEHIPLPAELALVVVDSGVSRSLESSAYAERRRELEAGEPSRVRHVASENRRVSEVAAILREPGVPRLRELGALFAEGHESLRRDFEVTIPELDLLVEPPSRQAPSPPA